MKTPALRTLISHGLIGLSLAAGMQMLWVQPVERAAADARTLADARSAEIVDAEAARDSISLLDRELTVLRAEARRIDDAGKLVRDPSGLFAAVGTLAAACNVRVDQMDPLAEKSAGRAHGAHSEMSFAYRITARADYADLVRFLRMVSHDLGLTRIRSATFSPIDDGRGSGILATIETEHFAFDVPRPDADLPGGR